VIQTDHALGKTAKVLIGVFFLLVLAVISLTWWKIKDEKGTSAPMTIKTSTGSAREGYKSYTNKEFGLSLTYPTNWKKLDYSTDKETGNSWLYLGEGSEDIENYSMTFDINKSLNAKQRYEESTSHKINETIPVKGASIQANSTRLPDITVDGHKVIIEEWKFTGSLVAFDGLWAYTKTKQGEYYFINSPVGPFDGVQKNHKEVFYEILTTFKFL